MSHHHHDVTAGIDIGDRYSHLCLLDTHSGEVIEEGRILTNHSAGYDPRDDLGELAELVVRNKLEIHVDRTFPLGRAADAHRYLEERRNRGKVIIHPGD